MQQAIEKMETLAAKVTVLEKKVEELEEKNSEWILLKGRVDDLEGQLKEWESVHGSDASPSNCGHVPPEEPVMPKGARKHDDKV